MGILEMLMTGLGLLPTVLDALKTLFADVAKLFDGLGQTKASAVTQQAVDITGTVENDVASAAQWFKDTYPTIEALLAEFPGIAKLMYSAVNIQKDQQIDLHTALTASQLGANSVKITQQNKTP